MILIDNIIHVCAFICSVLLTGTLLVFFILFIKNIFWE